MPFYKNSVIIKKIGFRKYLFYNTMKEFFLIDTPYDEAITELTNAINTLENTTYSINFLSDFSNSKIIRDFVGAIFDAFSIFQPWRGRFILITDELINNSIEHGSSKEDINRCIITAGYNHEKNFYISLEVHDTGSGEKTSVDDMETIKNNRTNAEENGVYMEKRGRGLFHITEKIVDKLSFSESEK